jgi:hypothetical protein
MSLFQNTQYKSNKARLANQYMDLLAVSPWNTLG